ncbi:hypothetical protein GCM10007897_20580 [Sphingobium jiangsuense]|uniref:Anti-sigma factor NepR domain-containing protein n=1 Tax=Sphingobium jiangsuense TaxID=870476 RepID=A0A7W6BIM5_9SPHN|nr:NepR family anti-sigma factor [Sphingobium jiangsuense]MBB3926644.1 hypothetical protein [Sphingobium jiangsuense]GLT00669.1 hypothetical protein GCM10007897_20580 [Sphingobium jiangsuense]
MTDNDDKPLTGLQTRPGATPAAPSCSTTATGGEHPASPPKGLTEEDANLGHALRAIYQQTVEEAIPDEMLNLLRHLD